MINVTEELERMKSSLWGYDKELVQILIKDLLAECEQEASEETGRLREQNHQLKGNLKETQERLRMVSQQFEQLT